MCTRSLTFWCIKIFFTILSANEFQFFFFNFKSNTLFLRICWSKGESDFNMFYLLIKIHCKCLSILKFTKYKYILYIYIFNDVSFTTTNVYPIQVYRNMYFLNWHFSKKKIYYKSFILDFHSLWLVLLPILIFKICSI